MLVTIEGPPACGKSTLAETLRKQGYEVTAIALAPQKEIYLVDKKREVCIKKAG